MDCSPPGSSVHGIFQARILERVAISFSRGSFRPRDGTWVFCLDWQVVSLPLSPLGSPYIWIYVHIYIIYIYFNSLGQKFSTENDCSHAPHLCPRGHLGISGDSFKPLPWLKDGRALNTCLFPSSSEMMLFNGLSLLCLVHLSDFSSFIGRKDLTWLPWRAVTAPSSSCADFQRSFSPIEDWDLITFLSRF